MAETVFRVDPHKSPEAQDAPIHNRWHPTIPPVASVLPGKAIKVECLDWTGGQIANTDSAQDVHGADLTRVHCLSGPFFVEGAKPGDLLVVEILDLGPLPEYAWGFTGIFAKSNGGGFLTDEFPEARKAIWDFEGIYTSSRHIPGVRFPGIPHPGILGTAPSKGLLEEWNRREADLVATDPGRVPALAYLPEPKGAILGGLQGSQLKQVAMEAARTIPPRENGGNCDIKNLSKGSKAFLPVFVDGAGLSVGDLHFSQGDGEITFCGAIEMAGWIELGIDILKGGMDRYGLKQPIFLPGTVEPRFSRYLTFEGISVDERGRQHFLDASVAFKRACLNAIDYIARFGYSREQAYAILGAAPIEGRISGIVDVPNACATLYVPLEIFPLDLVPAEGLEKARISPRGSLALV